jgi:hypothetical protein
LPTLTPDVVADEEALAEAVDEVVRRDPVARGELAEITNYQDALRGAVDDATWRLVLRVDELTTARFADVLLVVARWAFNEGVRSDDPPRGGA